MRHLATAAVALAMFSSACAFAQLQEPAHTQLRPKGYLCRFTPKPVKIDGLLDDEAWTQAEWTGSFVDIRGDESLRPRYRTRAKLAWDEKYLYIAAGLEEPNVVATLLRRDTVIFRDNDFEVFIDPDGDNHSYYEMEINAYNTVWDLYLPMPYRDGGTAVDSWDIEGLKTAVHVEGNINDPIGVDEGWTVEIAMPWKSLRKYAGRPAPPAEGDTWRMNFSRVEWKYDVVDGRSVKVKDAPEDNWVWSPQGVVDMHRPEMWGFVQFTRKKNPEYIADPSWPARDQLMHVYYAQLRFKAAMGRWAFSVEELKPRFAAGFRPDSTLAIQIAGEGYEATVMERAASSAGAAAAGRTASPRTWYMRQDSRIWTE